MQRADQIVVSFLGFVVDRCALLDDARQRAGIQRIARAQLEEFLCEIEQVAPIAIGHGDQGIAGLGLQWQLAFLEGFRSLQEF